MKKLFVLILVLLMLSGCSNEKEEPGNAYPVMMQYDGVMYFHKGYCVYEITENFEIVGEIKKVPANEIKDDFEGNEAGFIYENAETGELLFKYKNWNEKANNGKEPFLLLVSEK
ncbi:MAG: membrane lipoprotein lipid attachment site-containing protein [Oscillospiraceae bacterium]|nr:membrane lipoprotein lipid attachment site-containing protein [Oscillospiraceae bacterium]